MDVKGDESPTSLRKVLWVSSSKRISSFITITSPVSLWVTWVQGTGVMSSDCAVGRNVSCFSEQSPRLPLVFSVYGLTPSGCHVCVADLGCNFSKALSSPPSDIILLPGWILIDGHSMCTNKFQKKYSIYPYRCTVWLTLKGLFILSRGVKEKAVS